MKYLIWIIVISAVIVAGFFLWKKAEENRKVTEAKGSPKPENPDGENPAGGESDQLSAPGMKDPFIINNFDDLMDSIA